LPSRLRRDPEFVLRMRRTLLMEAVDLWRRLESIHRTLQRYSYNKNFKYFLEEVKDRVLLERVLS